MTRAKGTMPVRGLIAAAVGVCLAVAWQTTALAHQASMTVVPVRHAAPAGSRSTMPAGVSDRSVDIPPDLLTAHARRALAAMAASPVIIGWGHVINAAAGRCLDADTTHIYSDGDKVQLWDCSGTANQEWLAVEYSDDIGLGFFHLVNDASGLCLDAASRGGLVDGALVQEYDCLDGPSVHPNQYWSVDIRDTAYPPHQNPIYSYWGQNVGVFKVLDAGASHINSNGDLVQIYHYGGAANQKWVWVCDDCVATS